MRPDSWCGLHPILVHGMAYPQTSRHPMTMVESLETRRLFSFDFPTAAQLAQSLTSLKADEAAASSGAKSLQTSATKDAALLKNDLNHLGVAKTQKGLLATATNAT